MKQAAWALADILDINLTKMNFSPASGVKVVNLMLMQPTKCYSRTLHLSKKIKQHNLHIFFIKHLIYALVSSDFTSYVSQAFFDMEYITSHPDDSEKITQLKHLMEKQVNMMCDKGMGYLCIAFCWI